MADLLGTIEATRADAVRTFLAVQRLAAQLQVLQGTQHADATTLDLVGSLGVLTEQAHSCAIALSACLAAAWQAADKPAFRELARRFAHEAESWCELLQATAAAARELHAQALERLADGAARLEECSDAGVPTGQLPARVLLRAARASRPDPGGRKIV